jgi:RimJ/RimL family protein N-acetyltransferase
MQLTTMGRMRNRLGITSMKPEDYEEAAEVYRQSRHYLVDISGESPENTGPELVKKEAAEADEHGAVFATIRVKENGRMVGVTAYQSSGYQGDPTCAWIALLMIAEPFQRLGYGSEACGIIENEILGNIGVRTIKLGVLANNPSALAFWNEMGYHKTGIREHQKPEQNVIILQKSSRSTGAAENNDCLSR